MTAEATLVLVRTHCEIGLSGHREALPETGLCIIVLYIIYRVFVCYVNTYESSVEIRHRNVNVVLLLDHTWRSRYF